MYSQLLRILSRCNADYRDLTGGALNDGQVGEVLERVDEDAERQAGLLQQGLRAGVNICFGNLVS
jgi:hypothetical protein